MIPNGPRLTDIAKIHGKKQCPTFATFSAEGRLAAAMLASGDAL